MTSTKPSTSSVGPTKKLKKKKRNGRNQRSPNRRKEINRRNQRSPNRRNRRSPNQRNRDIRQNRQNLSPQFYAIHVFLWFHLLRMVQKMIHKAGELLKKKKTNIKLVKCEKPSELTIDIVIF